MSHGKGITRQHKSSMTFMRFAHRMQIFRNCFCRKCILNGEGESFRVVWPMLATRGWLLVHLPATSDVTRIAELTRGHQPPPPITFWVLWPLAAAATETPIQWECSVVLKAYRPGRSSLCDHLPKELPVPSWEEMRNLTNSIKFQGLLILCLLIWDHQTSLNVGGISAKG